jgi:endonuclease/exonuclease/phosphatase (EEP) superfamily protein YafD
VHYWETPQIPVIYTDLLLPSGDRVALYGLHTRPMHPAIHIPFEDRALLQVARQVRTAPYPTIVAGDFNYAPWSYTLHRFRELSGLYDLRVGQGFYPTYPATHPLLGFPVDHVYVSGKLALTHFERLPAYGSDHFALLVTLSVLK